MGRLDRDFFARDTLTVARELLGQRLVRTLEVTKIRGAAKTADNAVSFTVQPGMGLKSVPISKTKA